MKDSGTRLNPEPDIYWACQRCTNCCRWPGFVSLEEKEIGRIAAFVGLDEHSFIQQYTELLPSRRGLGLISKPNHECIFLEGQDCSIQPVKPKQCAGFPNAWRFEGWRDVCEAKPLPKKPSES